MGLNPEYANALRSVKLKQSAYRNGLPLPLIAQKFIEMGINVGIKIKVEYGVKATENGPLVGYWIIAPEKDKAIFKQDIYIEDESKENVKKAMAWINRSFENLKSI